MSLAMQQSTTSRRQAPAKSGGGGERLWRAGPLTYFALVLGVILSIYPLYWMLVAASRTTDAINKVPPILYPGGELGTNIQKVLDNPQAYFMKGIINSIIVSSVVTIATVFFGSLAGFAFAKLRFRGKTWMMGFILATMMVPVQLGAVPLLMLMQTLGWVGSIKAVIAPVLISGFAVFMMRQYTEQSVPDELIEAARVDGCSTWRIFWNVVFPALRPAAAVLGLLTFMQTWNDFFWPFVVLTGGQNPTVQISLRTLNTAYAAQYDQIFAGTLLSVVPLLVVFVVFGRQIIGGIMEGAVKQ